MLNLYKLNYYRIHMYELLIKRIKEKRSLENLDDEFIKGYIDNYFKNNPKIKGILEKHPNRGKSRKLKDLNKELTLESHKSTKERMKIYPYIYKKIFSITGEPKIILDISCGLNPLSYKYLGYKPYYIATELTKKDCEVLRYYFKKENINGNVLQINLLKQNKFPNADIAFLFKILDIIKDKKLVENIIKDLSVKYIVVSFSLIDIKGKKMNYPLQGWFQRMLKRLNLKYILIKEENEI